MTGKREAKRDALRGGLIDAATTRIAENGLSGLRARDITADAGCALGALYTAFDDLDALIVEVNSRTLRRIDAVMSAAADGEINPGRQMKRLAAAYLDFARAHPRLWRALFDHALPEGRAVPDWHIEDQARLLVHIVGPLEKLQPALAPEKLRVRARTLFAAVHGIVSISLENRFVGIPIDTLDDELDRFVDLLLSGLTTASG